MMKIIHNVFEMQKEATAIRRAGKRIGFVPTMGYFHEGHLSLMRLARSSADIVIVSNFVNPTQFAPTEDLDAYPMDFERDCQMAESVSVDIMFSPKREEMYPDGFRTYAEVEEWGKKLCGLTRPMHFRGVTTVVLKLFHIIQPDVAVFGWKDAQQFLILCRMVKDLDLPIEMIGGEIVREKDGLAMSSRNKYLTPEERAEATVLSISLAKVHRMIEEQGILDTEILKNFLTGEIDKTRHGKTDYVEIVSMSAIDPISSVEKGNTLIALAASFGRARLIDNFRY
jgi:pantoate--beta-alanine ligase